MDAERWLKSWHDRRPGETALAFAGFEDRCGRSTYDLLAELVEPGDRVLDLACGDGFLLERMAAYRPAERVGVDLSEGELAAAGRRLPEIELVRARAQTLPFASARFDLVSCHMALMLMAPVDDALAEVSRVLRPGGRLALVVGGGLVPGGVWEALVGELRQLRFEHRLAFGDRRTRAREGLEALLAAAGLTGVTSVEVELERQMTFEELWTFFTRSYDGELLGATGLAELRGRASAQCAGWFASEGCRVGMRFRLATAVRAT